MQVGDDVSSHADRLRLVLGEVVGETAHGRMHLGPAELLVVGVLTRRHLHERRTAKEHLGVVPDEDVVVRQAWLVRAPCGRAPEDDRDGRDPHAGQLGDVVEHSAGVREVREVAA